MDPKESINGWENWSKHVLKELERLNENYESLDGKYSTLQQELSDIRSIRTLLTEVAAWKAAMMEVTSPTQLKELKSDLERLKTFRTASVTIWVVIQGLILIWMAVKEFI